MIGSSSVGLGRVQQAQRQERGGGSQGLHQLRARDVPEPPQVQGPRPGARHLRQARQVRSVEPLSSNIRKGLVCVGGGKSWKARLVWDLFLSNRRDCRAWHGPVPHIEEGRKAESIKVRLCFKAGCGSPACTSMRPAELRANLF